MQSNIKILTTLSSACRYYKEGDEPKKVQSINQSIIDEIMVNPLKSVFLKSYDYVKDNEYRIVWFPDYGDKALVSVEQLAVSYGYNPTVNKFYHPQDTNVLPSKEDMIDLYIEIKNPKLCDLVERV